MQQQKKYKLEELKIIFPTMDFSFMNHSITPIIPQLLRLLNGRIVGGIVRDSLLGIKTNDLDIATPYLPHIVMDLLLKSGFHPVGTGIEYGTVSLFLKNIKIEITSLRKDVKNFGRRAEVEFNGTWEEDSLRRDFTFNGLFLAIEGPELFIYDYHEGIEDLQQGVVRFIGNYRDRIQEDYLRILRFIRFFIRYSSNLDYVAYVESRMQDLKNLVKDMSLISMERVLLEVQNILLHHRWKLGIEMMNQLGISELFFHQILFIPSFPLPYYNGYREDQIRLIYIFGHLPTKFIDTLPLKKETRNLLLMYIRFYENPSVESIFYIWHKMKTLEIVNCIITLWQAIEPNLNNPIYYTNIDNAVFEEVRKITPLIHQSGPERGLEEKNMRIEFIKTRICKNV